MNDITIQTRTGETTLNLSPRYIRYVEHHRGASTSWIPEPERQVAREAYQEAEELAGRMTKAQVLDAITKLERQAPCGVGGYTHDELKTRFMVSLLSHWVHECAPPAA